jgi:hypothetical protein
MRHKFIIVYKLLANIFHQKLIKNYLALGSCEKNSVYIEFTSVEIQDRNFLSFTNHSYDSYNGLIKSN